MRIDRCICYHAFFADLKAVADATGAATVEDLQRHVAFGLNCGMCRPYVHRMLRTGETAFDRVIRDGEEPGGERAG